MNTPRTLDRDNIRNNIRKAHDTYSTVLPNGELFSLDTISTRLNNNVMVMGASGSNKTRGYVIPNLLAANDSYIVSDPKGMLYRRYADYMRDEGYRVFHLDFIHPEKSGHYNPMNYIRSSDDIMKLSHQILTMSGGICKNDPFWDRASEMLLSALIGYLWEVQTTHYSRTLNSVVDLIGLIDAEKWSDGRSCKIDDMFESLEEDCRRSGKGESWACRQLKKFRQTPEKTLNCVLVTLHTILGALDTPGIEHLMRMDNIDIRSIGKRKTVVFVEISDTDRSRDVLANIFYSQAMNILCSYADEECEDSRLPVPVRFILDDFGTNCRISGFENMISNIRSRGISATVILQSESQLIAGYGEASHVIIDNCDTLLYMGGNDVETARMISHRCNLSIHSVLTMPVGTNWMFRRGQKPVFSETADLSCYDLDNSRLFRESARARRGA